MTNESEIRSEVYAMIRRLLEDPSLAVDERTRLIGDGGSLSSMSLVELCLLLEDRATDLGFTFEWSSEAAMSPARSMFRTAGTLADAFLEQMGRAQ